MKFYLISDNVDTIMGFRLIGIDGVVVHEKKEVLSELNKAFRMDDVSIILITTKLTDLVSTTISELKLTRNEKLIVEIPDRHGTKKIGESIDKYISEAIGIKL
jgi:V/A-type H+-transporting ATPase subunit F